jgi:hypothetical protein
MLEEVQVAPRLLLGVVNLAARTLTLRTRKTSALREVEDQLQPTLLSVELDADNAPRVPQAERLLEEIRIVQEKLRSSKGRARSSRRDPTIPTRFSDEPVHPHRRLDVQPARQVVEGHLAAAVEA